MEYSKTVSSIAERIKNNPGAAYERHVDENTIIFGGDAELDSIEFFAIIADIEKHFSSTSGKRIVISITEIDDFDMDNPSISVGKLAKYINRSIYS